MNKACLSVVIFCASVAVADSGNISPGPTLTTGQFSDGHSLFSATHNPSVAALTIANEENWRFGYLPSVSMSGEVGDVNNFADDLDELIDILDDPSLADESVDETLDRFNEVLEAAGEQGYTRVGVGITAPLFPLYWRRNEFSGTFFSELSVVTQIRLGVLDEPLEYNDQTVSFTTGSAAYLKSGIEKRFAVGYAKPLFNRQKATAVGGQLYGGVKVKLLNLELSKQVMRLEQLEGKDIEDLIEDEYENNLESTTGVGLDIGATWVAKYYRAGLTLTNINSPSFDYGPIGVNCATYAEGSFARNNCEAAAYFVEEAGRITSRETHKKHAVATVDASVYILPNWAINGSLDLAKYDDMVGMETQNLHLSTAVNTRSYWVPDIRLGYQKNMAGSELSVVAVGLSFFDVITLDARIALDEVEVDGNQAPRSAAFSLAFEEKF